ncbi:adenosylmethionine decarboxylase [Hyperthermus butylicus]|uniref:Arginine decarboxylase proenzyme n=1 Tax=Hyperthermus butylicus (strain DSM 5456 / JCM 9403 / PLM1-5) TaxID=415426 RepID=ARGDC_HYPBU|nr:adenosylmethionine decarboxylase [Hyperthermus butylicus]A2BM05.1 RecName: Full=Arginine decarboxylase proenzyme; Short=ADC; Short=ArgDC; AltName: Full=Pyruvoyl-dependent arginine decarboxylase; Contains: RecName: Full=Arginine decarboxylase beta chain; Contains: RecName: Full=Arginine decarboxylase alpha chain; Flags: Precursor [Hyperthermus butylicus DSM 5456]ABM81016.1 S-adenosylmethionine decarboxylase [Hyperthermus butylicus DSM 5456]
MAVQQNVKKGGREAGGDLIVGKHVYGNLYGVDEEKLWDEELLKDIVVEAARVANMNLVDIKTWKFTGFHGGVSVIALVLESHISIHTWPDYGYATVDVYTCGANSDPWKAFNYIVLKLKPRYYIVHYADRSSIPGYTESEKR